VRFGYLRRKIEANKYQFFHGATIPLYEFAAVVLISLAMNLLTGIILHEGSELCAWQVLAIVAAIVLWSYSGLRFGQLAWKIRESWDIIGKEVAKPKYTDDEKRRKFIEEVLNARAKEGGPRMWESLEPLLSRALIFAALGFLMLCLTRLDEVIMLVAALVERFPSRASPTPTLSTTPAPTPKVAG